MPMNDPGSPRDTVRSKKPHVDLLRLATKPLLRLIQTRVKTELDLRIESGAGLQCPPFGNFTCFPAGPAIPPAVSPCNREKHITSPYSDYGIWLIVLSQNHFFGFCLTRGTVGPAECSF